MFDTTPILLKKSATLPFDFENRNEKKGEEESSEIGKLTRTELPLSPLEEYAGLLDTKEYVIKSDSYLQVHQIEKKSVYCYHRPSTTFHNNSAKGKKKHLHRSLYRYRTQKPFLSPVTLSTLIIFLKRKLQEKEKEDLLLSLSFSLSVSSCVFFIYALRHIFVPSRYANE